jgi:hypothetical protein
VTERTVSLLLVGELDNDLSDNLLPVGKEKIMLDVFDEVCFYRQSPLKTFNLNSSTAQYILSFYKI